MFILGILPYWLSFVTSQHCLASFWSQTNIKISWNLATWLQTNVKNPWDQGPSKLHSVKLQPGVKVFSKVAYTSNSPGIDHRARSEKITEDPLSPGGASGGKVPLIVHLRATSLAGPLDLPQTPTHPHPIGSFQSSFLNFSMLSQGNLHVRLW